jgi:hypothetical protein
MTLAQQLEQKSLQQGREEGRYEEALIIAERLIAQARPIQYIQDLIDLPENEIMDLINKN